MAEIKNKKLLIVAGDVSGDVHASNLLKEIKLLEPKTFIASVGGMRLQKQSDLFIYDLASEDTAGFTAPFKKIPLFIKLLSKIANFFDTQKPDAVILVDYYGFNSLVLDMAYKRKIPVFYYVAPQVWASRSWRTRKLAKKTKKVFTIYPFEPEFHKKYGGNAVFIGNPLMDKVPPPADKSLTENTVFNWQIGFLPGSRPSEIKALVPIFAEAFQKIRQTLPKSQAFLFAVPETPDTVYKQLLGEMQTEFTIVRETDYKQRAQMDFLVTCSGTATLENAILGVPMLVTYKVGKMTYNIVKLIIKVPFISLPNILAGKLVVKEYVQDNANASNLAGETIFALQTPGYRKEMMDEFDKIRESLGKKGMAEKAAKTILEEI